jgi:threonine dehydratase
MISNIIPNILNKVTATRNNFNISKIVSNTPLQLNNRLSEKYNCNVYIKREDLQKVRSFKIRGAYNKIFNLTDEEKRKGVVCASAGNHAQGVALTCSNLGIKGDIFIPEQTPLQKSDRIKYFGGDQCNVYKIGKNFNDCLDNALEYCNKNNMIFIHPYNDIDTIIGQATIAEEIFESIDPDMILTTIGGGGLASGLSLYSNSVNHKCKVVGIEADTCDAMYQSIKNNKITKINITDDFIDGASVSQVGNITFDICKNLLDNILIVNTGKVCESILDIYQNDGIISEPAGVLPIASLDLFDSDEIKGKNIVCILSGGNNDVSRYPEIIERSLVYKNLKHYYLVRFAQTPGQLKKFINGVLGEKDDICRFEYIKKTNKEFGDVLIGIQVSDPSNIIKINYELEKNNFDFIKLNKDSVDSSLLYSYIV